MLLSSPAPLLRVGPLLFLAAVPLIFAGCAPLLSCLQCVVIQGETKPLCPEGTPDQIK